MHATFRQLPASDAPRALSPAQDSPGRWIRFDVQAHVTLQDAVGWTVLASSGAVWITQDGDTRDIVLEAGQSFEVDRPGNVLISGLDQASVCVAYEPKHCKAVPGTATPRPASLFSPRSSFAA